MLISLAPSARLGEGLGNFEAVQDGDYVLDKSDLKA